MAHGYMREYDEDRRNDRDRWSDEDRERSWRGRDDDRNERSLSFMLGDQGWERREGRDRYRRDFRSSQDDHYLSWRERQIAALDRDYADYCREREHQFHQDFDTWRNRRSSPQPLQPGMTQSGLSADPSGEMQLTSDMETAAQDQQDPMETATLGTTSSRSRR
jgi:hypothetical protein